MKNENKIPLTPHRMNFLGRKRYSVDTNAADYENFHFDDIWKAIARLWTAILIIGILMLRTIVSAKKK